MRGKQLKAGLSYNKPLKGKDGGMLSVSQKRGLPPRPISPQNIPLKISNEFDSKEQIIPRYNDQDDNELVTDGRESHYVDESAHNVDIEINENQLMGAFNNEMLNMGAGVGPMDTETSY